MEQSGCVETEKGLLNLKYMGNLKQQQKLHLPLGWQRVDKFCLLLGFWLTGPGPFALTVSCPLFLVEAGGALLCLPTGRIKCFQFRLWTYQDRAKLRSTQQPLV